MHFMKNSIRSVMIVVMAIALTLSGASAQESSIPTPDSVYFYYANGDRIPLALSTEYVALEPFAVDADTTLETMLANDGAWQPAYLAQESWMLKPIDAASGAEALAQVESLRAVEGAAAASAGAWVNPVFTFGTSTLILTDEFIAAFPTGTDRAAVEAYNDANGAAVIRVLSADTYLLRALPGVDALMLANRYQTGGVARYSEPNWWVLFPRDGGEQPARELVGPDSADSAFSDVDAPAFIPNDTFHLNAWHIHNYGQFAPPRNGETPDADIDGREAWDTTRGSDTVIIAVLDDGVQTSHPDLDSKMVFPFDSFGNDNDPQPYDNAVTRDLDAHGTAVAGLAAAESNNSQGIVGVCHLCKIMPIRIFATDQVTLDLVGSIGDTVDAINHARTNGAAVINNSWGDAPSSTITAALRDAALNGRGGLGAVVVVAAGNEYQSPVAYPAHISSAVPGVISVAASTYCDTIKVNSAGTSDPADCSEEPTWGNNWGTENNLAAPGHYLPTTDLTGTDGYITGDYVANFGGTSGSAPIVAGVAGLLLSHVPTLSSDQVRDRLMQTTDPLYTAGFDRASGWGRLNAQKALLNTITNTGTPNDYRLSAQTIAALPFNTNQNIHGAFTSRTDPEMSCDGSAQTVSNTIWYKFVPAYTMTVNANTFGSNNNTVLAVYNNALIELACNQDFNGGITQSAITFSATLGATYWFMIGDLTSFTDPIGAFDPAVVAFNVSTPTPEPRFTVTANVTLQGRPTPPDPRWAVPISYQLKRGTDALVNGTSTTDLSGVFTLANLRPGEYTLRVKQAHALATTVTFTLTADQTVAVGTLTEGDANDDNNVNITDFSILAAAFGTTSLDVNYDARADFNGDLAINITDFSLLAGSFGQTGTPPLS